MPRVTEAHRRARRDEITAAAIRVLERTGLSGTSIAQIVTESGLSSGAIYANFENKAELAREIASSLLRWRLDGIEEATAAGVVRAPVQVLRDLFATMAREGAPIPLILQLNMPLRQRLSVLALLSLGMVVTGAGAVRTFFVWKSVLSPVGTVDSTWWAYAVWCAACVEVDGAVVSFPVSLILPFCGFSDGVTGMDPHCSLCCVILCG